MSLFELVLGKEVRKPMDLAIPMGWRDHFKEVVEMVKEHEEKYTQQVKAWLNVIFLAILALLKGAEKIKNLGTWDIVTLLLINSPIG
jgi:hypothetical protein